MYDVEASSALLGECTYSNVWPEIEQKSPRFLASMGDMVAIIGISGLFTL